MSDKGSEAWWASRLWQRHGLRIEEFLVSLSIKNCNKYKDIFVTPITGKCIG
jgi:hypothetical protein